MENYAVLVITTSGDVRLEKLSQRELSLDMLHSLIDGYVEFVSCPMLQGTIFEDARLIVDENGLYKDKKVNVLASAMYGNPRSVIVGDVVIAVQDYKPVPDVYAFDLKTALRLFEFMSQVRADVLEHFGTLEPSED